MLERTKRFLRGLMKRNNYLSHSAQLQRLKKVERIAGPRYDTRVNVEAPLKPVLEALCRTSNFYLEVRKLKIDIVNRYTDVGRTKASSLKSKYKQLDRLTRKLLVSLEAVNDKSLNKKIGWSGIGRESLALSDLCYELVEELRKLPADDKDPSSRSHDGEIHYIYRLTDAIRRVHTYSSSESAVASNHSSLLMNGEAGIGKTHLLCDLAQDRIGRKLPTFIHLGEEFTMTDPLLNIAQIITGSSDYASILATLNDKAARDNKKALIVVDAVNEAQTHVNWANLNKVKTYKNLVFVISIRRGYEKAILPATFIKSMVQVEHEGFTLNGWEAVTAFFDFFKVPLPDVPILAPEFKNPLFLKLFCETYEKPSDFRGHVGTTKLFEAYVRKQGKSVLKAIGESNEKNKVWNEVIRGLAIWMGDNGTERILEPKVLEILEGIVPGKSKRLLRELERHWLLSKVPHYTKSGNVSGHEYRFPYQRFSDHFIVRYLLKKHLTDKTHPKRNFYRHTKLGKILADPYRHSGLIEALAIQVPEWLKGTDLISVTSEDFRRSSPGKDSFLYSLVWRSVMLASGTPKYFNKGEILSYINKYLFADEHYYHQTLLTLISVAGLPDHPLNANATHAYLEQFTMAKRDAFWQKFLHYNFEDSSIVGRLIEWGWSNLGKDHISDESLELTCASMTWFLASSDRSLRDKATKALVAALTNRLPVVEQLLRRFEGVNDPYVAERLYAVAYGCCLRSGNVKGLKELAKYVYVEIFANGHPIPHILLRDYARGVIEVYLHSNADPSLDSALFRPPYKSNWPQRVPTLESLKKKYQPEDGPRDYSSVWSSVMYSAGSLADFGNYVVNSNLNNFSGTPLNSNEQSDAQILEEFLGKLSDTEKAELEEIKSQRVTFSILDFSTMLHKDRGQTPQVTPAHIATNEAKFKSMLLHPEFTKYRSVAKRHIEGQYISSDTRFDVGRVQRLIFQKVVNLGWDPTVHGEQDKFMRDRVGAGESSRERIGKKYQWIALHEMLARVADNFKMTSENSTDRLYEGPSQLSIRDIDPSHTLRLTQSSKEHSWWFPVKYDGWKVNVSEEEWKSKVTKDLPDFKKLLEVSDEGGKSWLSLKGFYQWDQPIEPEDQEKRYDIRRREVWYHVYGYIVHKKDAQAFYNWSQKQNFWNHWMPESHEFYNVFLREFPHYPAFETINKPYYGRSGWVRADGRGDEESCPVKIMVANDEYMQESSSKDSSLSDGFSIQLPSNYLYKNMVLSSSLPGGSHKTVDGLTAFIDPSVNQNGPKVLLANKGVLVDFLEANDLTLMWTVMGEKMGIGGNRDDRTGRLMINGSFWLKDKKIVGGINTKYEE